MMPINNLAEDMTAAAQYATANQQRVYIEVAILTYIVLDIASTLRIEVDRVWRAKQTATTMMFYFIRYVPAVSIGLTMMSGTSYEMKYMEHACHRMDWIDAAITIVVHALAELLMVMRVWALYEHSKRALVILGTMYLGATAVAFWGTMSSLSSLTYAYWPRESTPIAGCPAIFGTLVDRDRIMFVTNMIFAGIIYVIMLYRCLARDPVDQPHLGTWKDVIGIRTAWPLIHVLIRDGCVYFLMVFGGNLILLLIMSVRPHMLYFTLPAVKVMYSIPAAKMIMNLREGLHAKRAEGGQRPADIPMQDMSTLNFTPRSEIGQDTRQMLSESGSLSTEDRQERALPGQLHRRSGHSEDLKSNLPKLASPN